jgi:four helix bundle protein
VSPHKNLEAWKVSMLLVEEIYKITRQFPSEERFGLISQMRRAAISVPSNIAEGAANRTKAQFGNFLSVAIGSLAELDTQLEISSRLNYVTDENFEKSKSTS